MIERVRITHQMAVRMIVDVFLVNASFLLALLLRAQWEIEFNPAYRAREGLDEVVSIWGGASWLLTCLSVIIFAASGFYTYGRAYRGRYKALIVLQAVSLSYVTFIAAFYFGGRLLPHAPPRGAFLLAWGVTLALVMSARVISGVWRGVVHLERGLFRDQPEEKVERVLVIGGAGYIGSILCRQLLEKGFHVRVLDALFYGDDSIQELYRRVGFEFVKGDSRDVEAVVRAMHGVQAVIHLGEIVGDPATALDEQLTREINVAATRMVAEIAKGYRVKRFIYASSCSVYGASDELLDEQSQLNPVSIYASAKIEAEKMLLSLNDDSFSPTILRFATVYGISPRPRFDLVVNVLTAKAVKDKIITVFGGDQWRPFVHVSDVARAIGLALTAPKSTVGGEIFNVGSDEQNMTIEQLGNEVNALFPDAKLTSHGSEGDRRNYRVRFSKIRNRLGFVPSVTVPAGIQELGAALHRGVISDYTDARYSNYKTLNDETSRTAIRNRNINELYARASERTKPKLRPEPIVTEAPLKA